MIKATITLSHKKNPSLNLLVQVADNFFSRFLGLMGKAALPEKHGLLLSPCNSIHMMFMRFPIDAIYINSDFHIIKVTENLKPWIGFSMCPRAWGVIEFPAGTVADYREYLLPGTQLVANASRES